MHFKKKASTKISLDDDFSSAWRFTCLSDELCDQKIRQHLLVGRNLRTTSVQFKSEYLERKLIVTCVI